MYSVPIRHCGKNNVGIVENEVNDLVAKAYDNEGENDYCIFAIVNEEAVNFRTVLNEEFNNLLRIVDEPFVNVACHITAAQISNSSNELGYEITVELGSSAYHVDVVVANVLVLCLYDISKSLGLGLNLVNSSADSVRNILCKCGSMLVGNIGKGECDITNVVKACNDTVVKRNKCVVGILIELFSSYDECRKVVDILNNICKRGIDEIYKTLNVCILKTICIKYAYKRLNVFASSAECEKKTFNIALLNKLAVCIIVCIVIVVKNEVLTLVDKLVKLCDDLVAELSAKILSVIKEYCDYLIGNFIGCILGGNTLVELLCNVLMTLRTCVSLPSVLEYTVELGRNVGYTLLLKNCGSIIDRNVSGVTSVCKRVCKSSCVAGFHKSAENGTYGNVNGLAVSIKGNLQTVNRVEVTYDYKMCIGVDLVDTLKNLNVVVVVTYKTKEEALRNNREKLLSRNALVSGKRTLENSLNNVNVLANLTEICIGEVLAPIHSVNFFAIYELLNLLTNEGSNVTAAKCEGDHICLLNLADKEILLILGGITGVLHSVSKIEFIYELIATEPYEKVIYAETALVELLVVGRIICTKEHLCEKNRSLNAEDLIFTIVLSGSVLVKTVTGKSRVTERYIVINLTKILRGSHSGNFLKRSDKLIGRSSKSRLLLCSSCCVKLSVKNLKLINKEVEFGAVKLLCKLAVNVEHIGISNLNVIHSRINVAVLVKNLEGDNYNANLLLESKVKFGIVEDNTYYSISKIRRFNRSAAENCTVNNLNKLCCGSVGHKVLVLESGNKLLNNRKIFHPRGIGAVGAASAARSALTACSAQLAYSVADNLNDIKLLFCGDIFSCEDLVVNGIGDNSSRLIDSHLFNNKRIKGRINDSHGLLGSEERIFAAGQILNKSLNNLYLRIFLKHFGIGRLDLSVNGHNEVKLLCRSKSLSTHSAKARKRCGRSVVKKCVVNEYSYVTEIKLLHLELRVNEGIEYVVYDRKGLLSSEVALRFKRGINSLRGINNPTILSFGNLTAVLKDVVNVTYNGNSVLIV